jgi:hypothetical protein
MLTSQLSYILCHLRLVSAATTAAAAAVSPCVNLEKVPPYAEKVSEGKKNDSKTILIKIILHKTLLKKKLTLNFPFLN